MAKRGGSRPGAGRKSKAEELGIPELMQNTLPTQTVFNKLSEKVDEGDLKAIELWLAYLLGKPKQFTDVTSNGESLIFNPIDLKPEL